MLDRVGLQVGIIPDNEPQTREPEASSPHVLMIQGGKLTWLRALGSRRAETITAILAFFTGFLITDAHSAYQQMLPRLVGIRQCAALTCGRDSSYCFALA
ncbi:MAG TPA: hypothetical protein VF070_08845 [Streptosporangiaceae bacterium]